MSNEVRRSAAAKLARLMGTAEGRDLLAELKIAPGQPIVVVEPSDTLAAVFARLLAEKVLPPATLAVAGSDGVQIVSLHLAGSAATDDVDDDCHLIDTSSTVGMLLTYLATREGREITFMPTWGVTAQASVRELVSH